MIDAQLYSTASQNDSDKHKSAESEIYINVWIASLIFGVIFLVIIFVLVIILLQKKNGSGKIETNKSEIKKCLKDCGSIGRIGKPGGYILNKVEVSSKDTSDSESPKNERSGRADKSHETCSSEDDANNFDIPEDLHIKDRLWLSTRTTEPFLLHKAAFLNKIDTLKSIIRDHNIGEKDLHGNTALHIAAMLGHTECINLLLSHNAPIHEGNLQGWSPFDEAISFGNRDIVTSFYKLDRELISVQRASLKQHLLEVLRQFKNFYVEFKWDFHIPLISRIFKHTRISPFISDTWCLYKQGKNLRFDTNMFSAIYQSDDDSLYFIDHPDKVYDRCDHDLTMDHLLNETIDMLMSTDITGSIIEEDKIEIKKMREGWFSRHKVEKVGEYDAVYYSIEVSAGLVNRREHLTTAEIKENEHVHRRFVNDILRPDSSTERPPKDSLRSPPYPKITWDQYMKCPPGKPPHLARPHDLANKTDTMKATFAMSQDFPLTLEELLDHVNIKDMLINMNGTSVEEANWIFDQTLTFVNDHLPPGFPVKIQYQLFPAVFAELSIHKFVYQENTNQKLFQLPVGYSARPNWFTPNKEMRQAGRRER